MSVDTHGTGKREQTKARNRSVLLEAAREVFVELGYDAATVRDIVARTNLAPGTFYNYFPDKRSVLTALIAEVGAEDFVQSGFRAFFEFIVADPVTFAFLRRNLGTIRERFGDTVLPAGLGELEADLREAIARGDLPDVDVGYLAHAMLAVGLELGQELAERRPPDVEGATAFVTALFSGGMERLPAALR